MFAEKGIWDIIQFGGFTIWILILCSIGCLAVILQKIIHFRAVSRIGREPFMESIRGELQKKNYEDALRKSLDVNALFSGIVSTAIGKRHESSEKIANAMERQIDVEISMLEKNIFILGTVGSVSVYIGLFGTVIGIIKAFQNLSGAAGSGINLVIGGIAEALVSTAAGIIVAVLSVVSYNYFIKKIDDYTLEMELCSSEIADILQKK